MCGICGIHVMPEAKGTLPVGRMMDELLLGIEHRGRDATGYISVGFDNQVQVDKTDLPATMFVKARKKLNGTTQTILGHTRLATQGEPRFNQNNHPVQCGTSFIVHNGHIWNDHDLVSKNSWDRGGSDVDSFVIAAVLNEYGTTEEVTALEQLEGAMAIAAIDVTQPGRVLLAKGMWSPLYVIVKANKFIAWASTVEALQRMWGACFGTPPSRDKFENLIEGSIIVIENGLMYENTFEPQTGEQYVNGNGYWYDTYTPSTRPPSGLSALYDYDDEDEIRPGYWETEKNGTKRYHSLPSNRNPIRTDLKPGLNGVPYKQDIDVANSFLEWAEADGPVHLEAIAEAARLCGVDTDLAFWLMFLCDPQIVETDDHLSIVRNYLDEVYRTEYDRLLARYLDKEKPARGSEDSELDCVDCGVQLTDEYIYRCGDCLAFRAQAFTEDEAGQRTVLALAPESLGGE